MSQNKDQEMRGMDELFDFGENEAEAFRMFEPNNFQGLLDRFEGEPDIDMGLPETDMGNNNMVQVGIQPSQPLQAAILNPNVLVNNADNTQGNHRDQGALHFDQGTGAPVGYYEINQPTHQGALHFDPATGVPFGYDELLDQRAQQNRAGENGHGNRTAVPSGVEEGQNVEEDGNVEQGAGVEEDREMEEGNGDEQGESEDEAEYEAEDEVEDEIEDDDGENADQQVQAPRSPRPVRGQPRPNYADQQVQAPRSPRPVRGQPRPNYTEPEDIQEEDEDVFSVRAIIDEDRNRYLVDWEDDPRTGESFEPSWEPKSNVNEDAVEDWLERGGK